MNKEEILKHLKNHEFNANGGLKIDFMSGYDDAIEYAIKLVEHLDDPQKVVIPKFVAEWIQAANERSANPMEIVSWINKEIGPGILNFDWLQYENHQQLLLNAIANGYEVENEPRYRVKVDNKLYFQRFDGTKAVFLIDDSLGVKVSSLDFTREEGNQILETLGVENGQLEEVDGD